MTRASSEKGSRGETVPHCLGLTNINSSLEQWWVGGGYAKGDSGSQGGVDWVPVPSQALLQMWACSRERQTSPCPLGFELRETPWMRHYTTDATHKLWTMFGGDDAEAGR